jgi:hypothetical protein
MRERRDGRVVPQRGGDVLIAVGWTLEEGDVDVATPFQDKTRTGGGKRFRRPCMGSGIDYEQPRLSPQFRHL